MATLVHYPANLSAPRLYPLDRRVLQIGAHPDNEAQLEGTGVNDYHAHLVCEKGSFTLSATDRNSVFWVNGKKKKSARLQAGDTVTIGGHLLRVVLDDTLLEASPSTESSAKSEHFQALHRFSLSLMGSTTIKDLLSALLDQLISLTGADKAFLILMDDDAPRVRVARNIDESVLADPEAAISDSIVRDVLNSGRPLIVADALSHEEFRTSVSVVNLKLCSVMCVPLVAREQTLGLFYLGNDNIVNNFDDDLLSVVTVFASQAALILANALSRQELERELTVLENAIEARRFGEIIGASDSMREIFKKISRVASTDISVLVEGETGTGKELVARAIHERSNRADKPFIVINCGAIPENLLESELFGHVRGAFTGAVTTTTGRFQAADGGTLFLDEIGEMPLNLQVKLLRVLQEKRISKVGETKERPVDIRIVAATNKRLSEEIQSGAFREDLYYRLNVINLRLPPLRERGDDVLLIANYFISRFGEELIGQPVALSTEARQALKRWEWPGNIRELENRIKKAVVFSDNGVISAEHLDLGSEKVSGMLPLSEAREAWQRDYINAALAMYDGNRTQTARILDVDPRTIFRHLERERGES